MPKNFFNIVALWSLCFSVYTPVIGMTEFPSVENGSDRVNKGKLPAKDEFVILSTNNPGLCSTDGIAWDQANMSVVQCWQSVCYGGGKYVAIALDSNVAAYSTDGITWVQTNMPSFRSWRSVCYGAGRFVAVAEWSNVVAYSTDGISWKETTLPSYTSRGSICYGNGNKDEESREKLEQKAKSRSGNMCCFL